MTLSFLLCHLLQMQQVKICIGAMLLDLVVVLCTVNVQVDNCARLAQETAAFQHCKESLWEVNTAASCAWEAGIHMGASWCPNMVGQCSLEDPLEQVKVILGKC